MTTLISQELTKEGMEVVYAGNGEDAVKQFQASRPDLLLLDIVLPKKSGLEALSEIRALPDGERVPAIILSNMEEPEYRREAERLGAAAYLIKANVQLPEIAAKVKAVMKR